MFLCEDCPTGSAYITYLFLAEFLEEILDLHLLLNKKDSVYKQVSYPPPCWKVLFLKDPVILIRQPCVHSHGHRMSLHFCVNKLIFT